MKRVVRRMGKARGVVIPKSLLKKCGLKVGDKVEIVFEQQRAVISLADPRDGWARESKALAAAGEAGSIWPDAGDGWEERWKW